ncbi:urate hydroxylase PuuD [Pandoraea terrigena]|uniref:Membrane protein n=1 Tax=Pandoraea terrigena TaxID=2508292 RepID=A0A5E4X0F7_9BURK|nr:urate hydroxylase PuuD [Pandoraea terrigena]VVE29748.1 membrane protein [Pandoraea terrigena]
MEAFITDWVNLLLRWLHVVAAIAWIGESFYFVMLDNGLKPPKAAEDKQKGVFGEMWSVHGGGFYHAQKYLNSPPQMPEDLHWSKWKSYTTWLSGFGLFCALYLLQPQTYLIDKNVMDLQPGQAVGLAVAFLIGGWFIYDFLCRMLGKNERVLGIAVALFVVAATYATTHIFAGRAAFLIVGAMMATSMSANVFFWIIPGQRKSVDALSKGEVPNPIWGKLGKQRSVHNTYFTLPVVFIMISNHYAFTYSNPHNWVILSIIMAAGAMIRQFFVLRHAGKNLYVLPAAGAALLAGVAVFAAPRPAPTPAAGAHGEAAASAVKLSEIQPILTQRCATCHSAKPTMMGSAPAGVMFDTPAEISQNAQRIYQQAVALKAMPLGNVTQMTDGERQKIAAWFNGGAQQ